MGISRNAHYSGGSSTGNGATFANGEAGGTGTSAGGNGDANTGSSRAATMRKKFRKATSSN